MISISGGLTLFSFLQLSLVCFTSAQAGAKCSDRIAELYPRQLFNLDKLMGEWYILESARAGETLANETVPFSCMSQVLSKQIDSDNLNLRLKLNLTSSGGLYIERDGQVNLTASNPTFWRWSYFDNPVEYWDGVVIATDYDNYWIHYECEEIDNFRYESAVVRNRFRRFAPGQKGIYESLLEGLGFLKTNFFDIPHIDCGSDL